MHKVPYLPAALLRQPVHGPGPAAPVRLLRSPLQGCPPFVIELVDGFQRAPVYEDRLFPGAETDCHQVIDTDIDPHRMGPVRRRRLFPFIHQLDPDPAGARLYPDLPYIPVPCLYVQV